LIGSKEPIVQSAITICGGWHLLAAAITDTFMFKGTLDEFFANRNLLHILEINPAGNLTRFLNKLSGHRLVEYPEFGMQNMDIPSENHDLVIHSDTLEHVPNPARGLSECRRILK
jgi:hypothetical protein